MMDEALRISGFFVKPLGSKRWCANFLQQRFQRHTVLQRQAGKRADSVHQSPDCRTLLRHRDEQFARLAVFKQADGQVAFVAGDVEFMGDGRAGIRQAAAQWAGRLRRAASSISASNSLTDLRARRLPAAFSPPSLVFLVFSGCERFEPSR